MSHAIVSQSDSNEMSTSCYAYLAEIRCVSIWKFGHQLGGWTCVMVAANHDKAYNGHPWISTNQKVANHKPQKLDTLSQHAIPQSQAREARMLSQHAQHRQAIPACTARYVLYKRGCRSPKQWTSWHSKIAVEPEETSTRRASSYNTLGG